MKTIPYLKLLFLFLAVLITLSCRVPADFHLVDGTPRNLSDYQGKWLIVNFWAEWCSPCRAEVPALNQLYANRSDLNIEIIGVSYDPLSNSEIMKIIGDWTIDYPVMATKPMPVLPFKLPNSLPGNYILNPEGELVARLKGEQSYQSVSKLLISLKNKDSQSE